MRLFYTTNYDELKRKPWRKRVKLERVDKVIEKVKYEYNLVQKYWRKYWEKHNELFVVDRYNTPIILPLTNDPLEEIIKYILNNVRWYYMEFDNSLLLIMMERYKVTNEILNSLEAKNYGIEINPEEVVYYVRSPCFVRILVEENNDEALVLPPKEGKILVV